MSGQIPDPGPGVRAELTKMFATRPFAVSLRRAELKRVLAYIDRVDALEPGLGREEGETEEESIRSALGALIDRGLEESERDDGLVAEIFTGELRPRRARWPSSWRILRRRLRAAWREVRGA